METTYFLELLKKNAILYTILINGNFSQVDLNSENVFVWTDKAIEIKRINIGQQEFDSVIIVLYDTFISMQFMTKDSSFFDNSKVFFGKDAIVRYKKSYTLGDAIIEEEYKNLGIFEDSIGLIAITLRHFNFFDYLLSLRVYTNEIDSKNLSRPKYFINGIEVAQELLHLFKPNEVTLVPIFTPYDYAPKIELQVKNPSHPVLKYFSDKAFLSYGGRLYEHRKIPMIDPYRICGLTYINESEPKEDKPKKTPVLIVETCSPKISDESKRNLNVSYDVLSPEIEFYKIDDHILTKDEVTKGNLDLERDYNYIKTLYGKEAVDEFGDLNYAQGISIYRSKE